MLNPQAIDLATLRQLWSAAPARLDDAAVRRVAEAATSVERIVASGDTVYGVNTGFGLLANTRIPDDRLACPANGPAMNPATCSSVTQIPTMNGE